MSTNDRNDSLKRRKAAIEEELDKRDNLTATERQVFAATGRRPARIDEPGISATSRQVRAVLKDRAGD